MRVQGIVGPLLVASLAIAAPGCGATRSATRNHALRGATTARAPSAATTTALTRNLLMIEGVLSSQFPNLHGIATPTIVRAAAVWAADSGLPGYEGQLETRRLDRLGFVAGVRENLYGNERSSAQLSSIIEEFRSHTGAEDELSDQHSQPRRAERMPGETVTPFPVPGIPTAIGYDTVIPDSVGYTVAFAFGPFYYQIQAIAPATEHARPSRAQVISAVTSLYRRLEGSLSV